MKTTLQALRKAAGFRSARAFAEHLGINVATYTSYEQGRYKLTLEQAWAFADALGEALGRFVPLDELAGREYPLATSPPGLAPDERELVDAYRSTDARGRGAIMRTAEGEAGMEGQPEAGVREAG